MRKYIFGSITDLWLRQFIKRFRDNGSNEATTTTMLRQNWKSFTKAITGKNSLIMNPSTIRMVGTTRKKLMLNLVALFLCTQNLFIGNRNVKEFNRIDVVLKFGVIDCTMFNVQAMNLVDHNSLIVTNHTITWNTITMHIIKYIIFCS